MNNASRKIYAKLTGQSVSQVAFNISDEQIDQIANIVKQIIAMFKQCKQTPENAVKVSHNPSEDNKKMVRKAVRSELGFFRNLFSGGKYVQAVLDGGQDVTVDDMKEVW